MQVADQVDEELEGSEPFWRCGRGMTKFKLKLVYLVDDELRGRAARCLNAGSNRMAETSAIQVCVGELGVYEFTVGVQVEV